ncbi:MAG: heavy metal-responsive transcriptional regulator [Candidatus Tectomicrobia bacterium]|uniref:Heavy metal-responsive transcriptional regulator n=1 Tax=Tectimicrobiota bacterium TaxID=2528274 RepID=A0A932HXT4_UNCTE|nr:heavy metal-responsive transcriptional regulator [Candidatus Tectomicrobia bacterium]
MPRAQTSSKRPLTIGALARCAGVHVETVRYYERRGLIERPGERRGAFRVYPPEAVGRLSAIKRAQALGFSLEEIRGLLELRLRDRARCGDVLGRAERKVAEIDEKIRALQRVRRELRALADACRKDAPASLCPVLAAFEGAV